MLWNPPAPFSPAEDRLAARMKRGGKFYVFLRVVRDRLFDAEMQAALVAMYPTRRGGKDPKPPALLAMVLLLQAYAKVGDEEAVRRAHMDKAWQMVLGWLALPEAQTHLAQSTLFEMRARLMAAGLDQRLLARTVALAKETGLFGERAARALRLVIDSAPLAGAGRVEDTINLLGHALRHVVEAVGALTDQAVSAVARAAGVPVVGAPSIKAGLDRDWNDPAATRTALNELLAQRAALETWLGHQPLGVRAHSTVLAAQAVVARIVEQDTEGDPRHGGRQIKPGVAADRLISLHDPAMRHGRKSQTERIDGYKRYIAGDLDAGVVLGVAVQPANQAEHAGADAMRAEVAAHGPIAEVHVDRAFLASQLVADVADAGGVVQAKPFPAQGTPGFTKEDFAIDLDARTVQCPAGVVVPILASGQARFPTPTCAGCPHRARCQKPDAKSGRKIQIHPREDLLKKLRAGPTTPAGRAALRARVAIEHQLAHVTARQGPRARYVGVRKNEYDLRRAGIIHNLFAVARELGISYELAAA
jgi:hypothetical protein